MSPEHAEEVFRETMTAWGLSSSDSELRNELLVSIAQECIHGTSEAKDWSEVYLRMDHGDVSFGALHDNARAKTGQSNPIRVWLRSFRNAEIPKLCYDLLSNPENVIIRAVALSNYGDVSSNDIPYCFDTCVDTLKGGMPFSATEIVRMNFVKSRKLLDTQMKVQSTGVASASHDASTRSANAIAGGSGLAPAVDASTRIGLRPLR